MRLANAFDPNEKSQIASRSIASRVVSSDLCEIFGLTIAIVHEPPKIFFVSQVPISKLHTRIMTRRVSYRWQSAILCLALYH